MATRDDNDREGNDKESQKNIIQSIVTNKQNEEIFSELLSGDNKIVRTIFRNFLEKGHFQKIRSLSQKEIMLWEDELCQEVDMTMWKKDILGQLGKIGYARAYVKGIVRNKCIDENRRLEKHVSMDLILEEKDYEIY
jgi:DNA-directed RNA polymerase specialized sigma24 family protein